MPEDHFNIAINLIRQAAIIAEDKEDLANLLEYLTKLSIHSLTAIRGSEFKNGFLTAAIRDDTKMVIDIEKVKAIDKTLN